jgi:hypothetical protein
MADEVRLAKADLKRPAPKASDSKAPDSKPPVTMQGLWRLMMWGATAAAALLIAVISSRGMVGSQRAAVAVATLGGSSVAVKQQGGQSSAPAENQPFDAQAETRRLSEAVRELASENDRLKARIGMVEHSVDDVTGSIDQQIKRAAAATPPWPDGPPEPATPANIAAVVAPALPLPLEYGADIGTAVSIQALRARWAGIRSAHPQLFGGLVPTVSLSALPPSSHAELRLVVGPFASAEAAAQLCASLQRFHQFCQPTIFAGQHLALE